MRNGLIAALAGLGVMTTAIGPALADGPAKISLVFASYGYGQNRKDVKDDVAKLCDGKASCKFKVANKTFPSKDPADPSPGDDKGLMMAWKCGDTQHKEQFAEGRFAKLSCAGDK